MDAKERHKLKILEHLGNPENEWILRSHWSEEILGLSHSNQIYQYFNTEEISEIEKQLLDMRRARYHIFTGRIDNALIKRAEDGDPQAIKLFYQRHEQWSEKLDHKVTGDLNVNIIRFSDAYNKSTD